MELAAKFPADLTQELRNGDWPPAFGSGGRFISGGTNDNGTGLVAAALLASVSLAEAQVAIDLSPEQRTTVYSTITRERVRTPPPAGLSFSVGAAVPAEVELYAVPESLEVQAIRPYRYTVWNNRVVLVDPQSRKVVQNIER